MHDQNLPAGWELVAIGDICTLHNGRAFKKTEWSKEGLPIIRIQNLNDLQAAFNYFDGELKDKHLVEPGTLLFAWSGTPGTSFGAHEWNGKTGALNQHIYKIDFSEDHANKAFFKYAINQKLDELIGNAQGGVGLRHVTKKTFEATEISFPPFSEQTRIANKLDELLAQVDTIKARVDAIPGILKRFRQSVLAAAVSGRLTEEWRKANDQALEEWGREELNDLILEMRNGLSPKPNEEGKGQPILRISAVRPGSVDQTDIRFLECEDEIIARYSLSIGDVLFTRYNGSLEFVGVCGLIRQLDHENLLYPDKLIRVRVGDKLLPEYLEVYFSSPSIRKTVTDFVKSTSGQKGISGKDLKGVKMLLPSVAEQEQIASRVEAAMVLTKQIEDRVGDAQRRIQLITQSILAKAFRGELVPQNPDDEPASVLLERIQAGYS